MKWSAVAIRVDTKEKLKEIRAVIGARTVSDAVEKLVEFYMMGMNSRIRDLMCRELIGQVMPLSDWLRKLHTYGLISDHVSEAVKYLTGNQDLMQVDREKCK